MTLDPHPRKFSGKVEDMAEYVKSIHVQVKNQIEVSNTKYKPAIYRHLSKQIMTSLLLESITSLAVRSSGHMEFGRGSLIMPMILEEDY